MLTSVLADGGGGSPIFFAERLAEMGAQFDREVQAAMDAAAKNGQHEARTLRDEVEFLQLKLQDESQQSAMRLGLCTELKQRLGETQESLQQEATAREYWRRECANLEESHSMLEAKLEGLMLTHEEQTGMMLAANGLVTSSQGYSGAAVASQETDLARPSPGSLPEAAVSSLAKADVLDPPEEGLELDASDVERYLGVLESGAFSAALDQGLRRLSADGLHALLVAASGRPHGAGVLVHRIIQLWVGRLLARHRSLALQAAVEGGSAEALAALLGLGGALVLAADAAEEGSATSAQPQPAEGEQSLVVRDEGAPPCLLSLCVQRGDPVMLGQLLEHLRGARSGLGLSNVRQALALAETCTYAESARQELMSSLSSHLVVELSHLGNAQYRHGELDGAISSYEEAIMLCERSNAQASSPQDAIPSLGSEDGKSRQVSEGTRENMVRLRYNLARTLHRSDRWSEARNQASEVIALDQTYANAYALRAQAGMAACDWQAAVADWDMLMSIIASVDTVGGPAAAHAERADLVTTWRKRREECIAQVSLGHYEALSLRRIASIDEVRQAYRELARQWHPDKHSHKSHDLQERACRRFDRIRQAFEVIGEESTKHTYDASLLLSEARPLMTGHGVASNLRGEKLEMAANGAKESAVGGDDRDRAVDSTNAIRVSRTDSPVGRNSLAHSPLNRWLPSFRASKTPQSGHEGAVPAIHVNLFDAKFVNAEPTDPLR